jgi:hypothetical protein
MVFSVDADPKTGSFADIVASRLAAGNAETRRAAVG